MRQVRQFVLVLDALGAREMPFQQRRHRGDALHRRGFRVTGAQALLHQSADAAPLLRADPAGQATIGDDLDAMVGQQQEHQHAVVGFRVPDAQPGEDVLQKLTVPTIFISGTKDAWINPEKVGELEDATERFELPVQSVKYEADHAFFNNTRPEVYDPTAAADAWARAVAFFNEKL